MTSLIVYALVLTIAQIWLIPALLNLGSLQYLISNRDDAAPEDSVKLGRVRRAAANLQESLPAFLALAILSIVLEVDNYNLAMYWLGFRVGYLLSYVFGIIYVRTLFWIGSIICLIMMAAALV
mgnify:CR=1 FL=1